MMNRKKQYRTISNDWKYIRRHSNPTKTIARNACDILFSALYQIKKYGHAILTHEALSEITETKADQNCILIKQLGFVLNAVFFRSLVENGKKYRDGYKFTLTENAEEILENPEQYFTNYNSTTSDLSGTNIRDIPDFNRDSSEPLLIYTKKELKNDIKDLREDQFINSDNFNSELADYVEASTQQNSECNVDIRTNEFENSKLEPEVELERFEEPERVVKTPDKPPTTHTLSSQATSSVDPVKTSQSKPNRDRITFESKDGNKLWGMPLAKYRYSEAMLEEIRDGSNKQHFTIDRVEGLFQRLAGKYPDKLIIGGKKGFISYMTKALNGEKEDYQEVILRSIEEQSLKAYRQMEYMLENNVIEYF